MRASYTADAGKGLRLSEMCNPLFHTEFSISDSLKNVRKSVLIYETIIEGMIHSYSKKAYPWDNACIESFHALLKREWINRFKIFNYTHAYKLIFEYIETFYNTVRIHSHCGYLSPNEYEEQYLEKLETSVTSLAS